jgi:hypothetical protein
MTDSLTPLTPDAARGARTVARCHRVLEARRQRIEAAKRAPNPQSVAVERLVLAGLCAVYLISMAGNVLQVIGLQ